MSTIKFAVTFNPHSDDPNGLKVIELREAQQLVEFASLRGMTLPRIIPVNHPSPCPCYLHVAARQPSFGESCCGNCPQGGCYVDHMTGEAGQGYGWSYD